MKTDSKKLLIRGSLVRAQEEEQTKPVTKVMGFFVGTLLVDLLSQARRLCQLAFF